MLIQQGDVLLKKVECLPVGRKLDHLTLAEGEATGHHHTITVGDAEIIEVDDKWYLNVLSEEAILTHQEHKPVVIPAGKYEIDIIREYDHFAEEARNVKD